MIRLIGIVITIGLADSLNPATIGPALVLAAGERPRDHMIKFTVGVFLANVIGGLLIALGPGRLLLSLIPHPGGGLRQTIEMVAGGALMAGGALLWRYRVPLRRRDLPEVRPSRHGAMILGASITTIELPTAFPYFGALAAIVGANLDPGRTALLIVLFNLVFLLPLFGVIVVLYVYGERAETVLGRGWAFLQAHWPVILAVAAGLAGAITFVLGATGFVRHSHTRLGRFLRHLLHVHMSKH
jgi:cytochrome c biogenesis protein CcdA